MEFANIFGLLALLSIIPLIILYLKKPKPIELPFSSLMFLIEDKKKSKQRMMFRRFIHNLLFFIQLGIIGLLAFSVAEPYLLIPHEKTVKNTIIIIDTSASMQTKNGASTRFDLAKDVARNQLTGTISIISSAKIPEVLLDHGSKVGAISVLNSLEVTDSITNLEAALFEAENILKDENAKIIVVSDFMSDKDDQIDKAKRILASKGNNVEFVDVSREAGNIGIVDMDVGKRSTRVYVKNYYDEPRKVTLSLIQDDKTVSQKEIKMLARSVEITDTETLSGQSMIRIDQSDDLLVDNIAYISSPLKEEIKVLLITNNDNSYLEKALRASPEFNVEVRRPPILETYNIYHDVIIIHDVSTGTPLIAPDLRDITNYISSKSESTLIITAQDNLESVGLSDTLPVNVGEYLSESLIYTLYENEFTSDIDFGKVEHHYSATLKDNSTLVLLGGSMETPMLTYTTLGKGQLIYSGMIDEHSDFKLSKDFPVFWNKLINFLINPVDISDFNKRIGNEGFYNYKKAGYYERDEQTVAVNLLDETESDIYMGEKEYINEEDFFVKEISKKYDYNIVVHLLLLALALILFELYYIKKRGEL